MPTRADCTPMVIGEAMAYGLPCITTDVGGVRSLVSAETGVVLSPTASYAAYAKALIPILKNPILYSTMAHSARENYEKRLNWDSASRGYLNLLDNALATRA